MTQYASPTSVTGTGWTGTAAAVADAPPTHDDATFLQSPPDPTAASVVELALGATTDPETNAGHVLRARLATALAPTGDYTATLELRNTDDDSLIATRTTGNLGQAVSEVAFALTPAEAALRHGHTAGACYLRIYPSAALPSGDETVFMYYPLEILLPKAGLDANHRIYRAYPGLEYNIRVAAIGGAFPYTFTLANAPAGMTISANGIISWPNPQTTASNIVVTVTDSLGATAQGTWSVTVGTAGFVFVDAAAPDDTGAGTLASPWKTLAKVASSSAATDICYFKTGTYTMDDLANSGTWGGAASYHSWSSLRSGQWLAYPGQSPVFDQGYVAGVDLGQFVRFGTRYTYFDGLEIQNIHTMGLYLEDQFVVRRCSFHDLMVGGDGSNCAFVSTARRSPTAVGSVVQDNTMTDATAVGCSVKLYEQEKCLIEGNTISACYGGVEVKEGVPRYTIRGNAIATTTVCGVGESMNSYGGYDCSGEICFNYINVPTDSGNYEVQDAIHLNTFGVAKQTDIYRNTLVGWVWMELVQDNTDGPFTFSHNVIQNSHGANTPINYLACENVTDLSRVTMHDNLTGASGLVDASGLLVNRELVGTYGHERVS